MPKKTKVKYVKPLSRYEELAILQAQTKEFEKNPELAVRIAQKAGILDKDGKLTAYYRQTVEKTEMPKRPEAKHVVRLSREEELAILDAQIEEAKKDPSKARKTAQRAGILDKNGKLTAYYKQTS